MQVFLTKDIASVGRKGQIISVKPGYFRNFLAPRKLAQVASLDLKKKAAFKEQHRAKKLEEMVGKAEDLKKQFTDNPLVFKKKASSKGKLFAAISEKELIEAIKEHYHLDLDHDNIAMKEHLKEVGTHEVTIKLSKSHQLPVTVVIEQE